jgi:hypothetical protein
MVSARFTVSLLRVVNNCKRYVCPAQSGETLILVSRKWRTGELVSALQCKRASEHIRGTMRAMRGFLEGEGRSCCSHTGCLRFITVPCTSIYLILNFLYFPSQRFFIKCDICTRNTSYVWADSASGCIALIRECEIRSSPGHRLPWAFKSGLVPFESSYFLHLIYTDAVEPRAIAPDVSFSMIRPLIPVVPGQILIKLWLPRLSFYRIEVSLYMSHVKWQTKH